MMRNLEGRTARSRSGRLKPPAVVASPALAHPHPSLRFTRPGGATLQFRDESDIQIQYGVEASIDGPPRYSGSVTCQDPRKLKWLADFVGREPFMVEVFRDTGIDVIDVVQARLTSHDELDLFVRKVTWSGRDVMRKRRPKMKRREYWRRR